MAATCTSVVVRCYVSTITVTGMQLASRNFSCYGARRKPSVLRPLFADSAPGLPDDGFDLFERFCHSDRGAVCRV
jgi:hypothetical protein